MSDDFREQIEYLADRAGEERARIAEGSKPSRVRSPLRKLLWIGAILAFLELGLLGYLSIWESRELSERVAVPNPLSNRQDCEGERYRTSRALLAYMREHGAAPDSLDALVGSYILSRPVDPITKLPLQYRRFANGFRIDCPPMPK